MMAATSATTTRTSTTAIAAAADQVKAKHDALRSRLHVCCAGEARQLDLTHRDNGQLFPPVGMCCADVIISKVDMSPVPAPQREVKHRGTLERPERELARAGMPYVPNVRTR